MEKCQECFDLCARWLRIMLHLQRTSKVLIRLVLLLLLIQFVTPAFAQVGTPDNPIHEKNSYKSQPDTVIAISVFLKETSEEKDEFDGKAHFCLELIDFTSHEVVLKQSHSQILWDTDNTQPPTKPLFKLFCIFLI